MVLLFQYGPNFCSMCKANIREPNVNKSNTNNPDNIGHAPKKILANIASGHTPTPKKAKPMSIPVIPHK